MLSGIKFCPFNIFVFGLEKKPSFVNKVNYKNVFSVRYGSKIVRIKIWMYFVKYHKEYFPKKH